jgi:5-methylcytosine-specific restriction protein A
MVVASGYCPQHIRHSAAAVNDRVRGTAAHRGYGYRWQKYSKQRLRSHPWCADPFAFHRDNFVLATMTDHITPVDGPYDPLFWPDENHQSLCDGCHGHKTATEDGGFGRGGRGSKSPISTVS